MKVNRGLRVWHTAVSNDGCIVINLDLERYVCPGSESSAKYITHNPRSRFITMCMICIWQLQLKTQFKNILYIHNFCSLHNISGWYLSLGGGGGVNAPSAPGNQERGGSS